MPYADGYAPTIERNNASALSQVQQAHGAVGILGALQEQQIKQQQLQGQQQIRQILSSIPEGEQPEQTYAKLRAVPGGIDVIGKLETIRQHKAATEHTQAQTSEMARQTAFNSPSNLAQFQTPGQPAIAAGSAPAAELGGGPPVPFDQPAIAPTTDLRRLFEAKAAQGIAGGEAGLNHIALRDQAKAQLQQQAQHWAEQAENQRLSAQDRAEASKRHDETLRAMNENNNATRMTVTQAMIAARPPRQEPQPHYITNADGVFQVNRDGTTQQVTAPDGKALSGKATADRVIPAPIVKAYTENSTALRKIDTALAELEKKPDAFGLTNMLGDTVRQRTDPEGVTARAIVADIGSLKIHDRSGAAVTVSETPRLKPFIPNVNDAPETIQKKLGLFRKEYDAIQGDLQATYNADQGYKPFPTVSPNRRASDKGGIPDASAIDAELARRKAGGG